MCTSILFLLSCVVVIMILSFCFKQTLRNDFLTTVSNAEGAGQPINVFIISPGCHIDEEVRRVPEGESKSEPVYTNVCMCNKSFVTEKCCSVFTQQRALQHTNLQFCNILFLSGKLFTSVFQMIIPATFWWKQITEQHILLKRVIKKSIVFCFFSPLQTILVWLL